MTETSTTPVQEPEEKKRSPVTLIFITVILALGLAFLIFSYFSQKRRMVEMEIALTYEKDSLANELQKMIYGYDTLKSNNDTLNANLENEKNRIKRLLSINASNVVLIRRYKNEIGTMREIMKSYIVQIDSLNSRNKLLTAENEDIKQQYNTVLQSNDELTKARKELTSKVEIASVIQAKDIIAVSLNKNRKETQRLDRIEKLRVCFTLRENAIAEPGKKTVFLRILRPDSLVITSSPDNLFDYHDSKLIYTSSREIDYLNQDVDMCIFVDNTGDFILGTYKAELYTDGSMIGTTTFMIARR